jgi:RHS repeat-associated protein
VLYAFDYGNRLRSIAGIDAYRYDAWGRRVRQSNTSGPIYSLYGRDGTLLWQRNERTGQRRNYVYLQGSLLAEDRTPLVGSTETVTYQHTDALGTPVATTSATKTVLQTSEYEPYGKLLNRPMEDGPDFTGHVSDAGSKLVYMQQRYYDPRTGRFWSTDPVTAYSQPIANFNRYRYAFNNPYHFTDADGRNAVTAIGGVVTEAWNAAHGRGFDTDMVWGALKDGYNEEGDGIASAAFQDATSLVPTGAVLGSVGKIGLLVREASLLTKTAEGATRIGASSLRGGALGRAEIAATRTLGKQFLQNNGSRAFVTKTANGKFNVAIFGKGGYMTSLKNISEKSLLKQAIKYEWTVK